MISDVYRFFSKPAAKLRDVCNGRVIERPKYVLVEGGMALPKSDLDAVCQQIVLTDQIFFLN